MSPTAELTKPKFSHTGSSGVTTTVLFPRRMNMPRNVYEVIPAAHVHTTGGVFYYYRKGFRRTRFIIELVHISESFYDDLVDFWANIVVGGVATFTYTDEDETAHTVRWISNLDTFRQEPPYYKLWYSGTIILEKVG